MLVSPKLLSLITLAFAACATRLPASPSTALKEPPSAEPGRRPMVARFISPYTYEWFVRAELARAAGRLPQAIEAYQAALASADEEPEIMARLGSALAQTGQSARAASVLEEASQLDPRSESVWLARAELLVQAGDLEGAYAALEHAEHVAPDSARGPLRMASLLAEHGQLERAQAVLERFRLRNQPSAVDTYQTELTRALLSRDPQAVFAATAPYRLGAAARPSARLRDAAQLLLEHGRAAHALRVLELLPASERDAALEIEVLLATGSLAQLEAWLTLHEPSGARERANAARAALLLRKVGTAAAIVEADRLTQPDTPILQLLVAQIELARGHHAAAAEQFARVPQAAAVSGEARAGLRAALSALGLTELASELRD
jgi:predicted Zn-dependent protease